MSGAIPGQGRSAASAQHGPPTTTADGRRYEATEVRSASTGKQSGADVIRVAQRAVLALCLDAALRSDGARPTFKAEAAALQALQSAVNAFLEQNEYSRLALPRTINVT